MIEINIFLKNKTDEKKNNIAQSVRHGRTYGSSFLIPHSSFQSSSFHLGQKC